ncbi:MAG: FAD-dependent oxidoreductase [Dissulfurispiraceae bacterium]
MNHLLIIGGSDAGISAALRARELDRSVDITVVLADNFPNFSICGLPFYLSGEVSDWQNLAHRTIAELADHGIRLLLNHTARVVDPANKVVTIDEPERKSLKLQYDRLVIATGAVPIAPPIPGLHLQGVYSLRTMADSFAVYRHLERADTRSVVILGSGYIGMEMADALTLRDLDVTVVGRSSTIFKTVDAQLGLMVEDELRRHGVKVAAGVAVERISQNGRRLVVSGTQGLRIEADMVLVSAGVVPSTELARSAGIGMGYQGAIGVNRRMETNVSDIYSAGDCVETWHCLLKQSTYLPLGTTAHKQGRVAGENAVGGNREFAGSLGTQVVKIFDLAVARTGLRDTEADGAGFQPRTVELTAFDHKVYYPGAHPLRIRITGDHQTGLLLGAQIVGHYKAEVAKRIDIFATALFHGMHVEDLNDLDLSYTPPLGSPWDPVQMSAQKWMRSE